MDLRTTERLQRVLSAFALLAEEIEGVHLLVETGDKDTLRQLLAAGDSWSLVHAVDPSEREQALSACDIVVAFGSNGAAIDALAHGRALLAADIPEIRGITPNGRGCLWFQPGSDRDLVFRASFLARNPDFRAALGANGRAHIQSTRGLAPIARRYDSVYRHAVKRHRAGNRPDIFHHVPALACC
jgi:glycosyltransferase involved in cell wall biosynthesis